jgi:DNA uptake protein ComE-like DNA-binding protein
MQRHAAVAGIISVALLAGGCMVSKSKYEQAVADTESVRTDLEKTRAQKSALESQVKSLKDANAKMGADAEFISAELQRIKESREKERSSVDGRVKELEQKVKDVTSHNRTIKQELEDVKKHNESLKATVARYQKELKERERSVAMPSAPALPKPPSAAAPTMPSPGTPPKAPGQPGAGAPPAMGSPSAMPPVNGGASSINVNTASSGDLVLFLGLSKEMADRVVANRPYKIKGELVAKNVIPKPTFDGIKDKITVAQ